MDFKPSDKWIARNRDGTYIGCFGSAEEADTARRKSADPDPELSAALAEPFPRKMTIDEHRQAMKEAIDFNHNRRVTGHREA